MRFSSLFQQAARANDPQGEPMAGAQQPVPSTVPLAELPDDLDARVRLVGEWQQLEG